MKMVFNINKDSTAPTAHSSERSLVNAPPPHDPREREVVMRLGELGAWKALVFGGRMLGYFASRGLAHVQLWHEEAGLSVLTPSRLTCDRYEAFPVAGWKKRSSDYQVIASLVEREHGVAMPAFAEVARVERALAFDLARAVTGLPS